MLRRARPLLGTYVEIGTTDTSRSVVSLNSVIQQSFNIIGNVHDTLSFHQPDSELSRINGATMQWVEVSDLTCRVIKLAKVLGYLSNNRFNATVGGTLVKRGVLPLHSQQPYLQEGDSDDIEVNRRRVRLKRPVLLTLDGIAKGYAVDLALQNMQNAGLESGWVNAGGDLRVFGNYALPVQRRLANGFETLHLCNAAMASSQCNVAPSLRFPACVVTSQPQTDNPLQIISVKAKTAWRADALTKVAANCTPQCASEVVSQLGGTLIVQGTKT